MSSTALARREISEQAFPGTLPIEEQLRFMLRYAILAPSARNSQPWRFEVEANAVLIYPDLTRWQVVADPKQRELYLSLGCALENLLIVAEYFGFRFSVAHQPDPSPEDPALLITFAPGGRRSRMRSAVGLETILARHTTHGRFTEAAVTAEHRQTLLACTEADGVLLVLSDDAEQRARAEGMYRRACDALLGREDYRRELAEVVGSGSFGMPWPVSALVARAIFSRRVARRLEGFELAALRTAPLLGVVASRDDSRGSQIRSGQLLERIWLTATACGLGVQPVSAVLELPETRVELATTFGIPDGYVAQELVRLGHPHGDAHRPTPRRAVEDVTGGGAA
jgi:nitroreductase